MVTIEAPRNSWSGSTGYIGHSSNTSVHGAGISSWSGAAGYIGHSSNTAVHGGGGTGWSGATGYIIVSSQARDASNWVDGSGSKYEDILSSGNEYTSAYDERGSQIAGDGLEWDAGNTELDVKGYLTISGNAYDTKAWYDASGEKLSTISGSIVNKIKSNLADLDDIATMDGKQDGYVLTWDTTQSKWSSQATSAGGISNWQAFTADNTIDGFQGGNFAVSGDQALNISVAGYNSISGNAKDGQLFSSNARNLFPASSLVNKTYLDNISSAAVEGAWISANAAGLYYPSSLGNSISGAYLLLNGSNANQTIDIGSQDIVTGGDITLGQKLIHDGDTNTYLEFTPDNIYFWAGGNDIYRHYVDSPRLHTRYNDGEHNYYILDVVDDQPESVLHVDTSTQRIGIRTDDPDYNFHVLGNLYATVISGGSIQESILTSKLDDNYYPSSLGLANSLHSSNSAIHSFNVANYITSTNAISRFADSSNINSRFVASGVVLTSISSQFISGGMLSLHSDTTITSVKSGQTLIYGANGTNATWQNVYPPISYSVANIEISSQQNINLARFMTPSNTSCYVLQAYAANSSNASVGDLKIQMLSGTTVKFSTSSNTLRQYSNPSSAAGSIEIRFMFSGSGVSGIEYGTALAQVGIW